MPSNSHVIYMSQHFIIVNIYLFIYLFIYLLLLWGKQHCRNADIKSANENTEIEIARPVNVRR